MVDLEMIRAGDRISAWLMVDSVNTQTEGISFSCAAEAGENPGVEILGEDVLAHIPEFEIGDPVTPGVPMPALPSRPGAGPSTGFRVVAVAGDEVWVHDNTGRSLLIKKRDCLRRPPRPPGPVYREP